MTTYNFQEIGVTATESFICTACGKRGRRSKRFWQTENPFNRTADGEVKSRQQIYDEVRVQADEWRPTRHAKCEGGER